MSEKFNAGDQVRLASGGPFMTVDLVLNQQVSCVWFSGNDLRRESFGELLLVSRERLSEMAAERRNAIRIDEF